MDTFYCIATKEELLLRNYSKERLKDFLISECQYSDLEFDEMEEEGVSLEDEVRSALSG